MKVKFKVDYHQTLFGYHGCNISIIKPSHVFCGMFMRSDDFYHWVWGESQTENEERNKCRDIMNMLTCRQRTVLFAIMDSSMNDKVSYTITLKMGEDIDEK